MGCLNSNENFSHWFGNIHLSGPCNRSCYFCIGQHMMSLDSYNTLDTWPLNGLDKFVANCLRRDVHEVNVTGTNTDPLLFKHTAKLRMILEKAIPNLRLGLRTNGAVFLSRPEIVAQYDKGSVTICSADPDVYRAMMGCGDVPDIKAIIKLARTMGWIDIKANVVIGPENCSGDNPDVLKTIQKLADAGFNKINLREPYGQSHVGNPLAFRIPDAYTLGMPTYQMGGASVVYWDVHYVEVESVNLYASGHVSETYPITKGHDPIRGVVKDQSNFGHGRHRKQWLRVLA